MERLRAAQAAAETRGAGGWQPAVPGWRGLWPAITMKYLVSVGAGLGRLGVGHFLRTPRVPAAAESPVFPAR